MMNEENKKPWRVEWSTADELEFIRNLGTHRDQQRTPGGVLSSLKKYKDALSLRKNWGRIDWLKIETTVSRLIDEGAYLEVVE